MIGHPIRHSISPVIHNAAFRALDLDWVFTAFEVAPGRAAAAVEGARDLGLAGLSVTMPHKAMNTLWNTRNRAVSEITRKACGTPLGIATVSPA